MIPQSTPLVVKAILRGDDTIKSATKYIELEFKLGEEHKDKHMKGVMYPGWVTCDYPEFNRKLLVLWKKYEHMNLCDLRNSDFEKETLELAHQFSRLNYGDGGE